MSCSSIVSAAVAWYIVSGSNPRRCRSPMYRQMGFCLKVRQRALVTASRTGYGSVSGWFVFGMIRPMSSADAKIRVPLNASSSRTHSGRLTPETLHMSRNTSSLVSDKRNVPGMSGSGVRRIHSKRSPASSMWFISPAGTLMRRHNCLRWVLST